MPTLIHSQGGVDEYGNREPYFPFLSPENIPMTLELLSAEGLTHRANPIMLASLSCFSRAILESIEDTALSTDLTSDELKLVLAFVHSGVMPFNAEPATFAALGIDIRQMKLMQIPQPRQDFYDQVLAGAVDVKKEREVEVEEVLVKPEQRLWYDEDMGMDDGGDMAPLSDDDDADFDLDFSDAAVDEEEEEQEEAPKKRKRRPRKPRVKVEGDDDNGEGGEGGTEGETPKKRRKRTPKADKRPGECKLCKKEFQGER